MTRRAWWDSLKAFIREITQAFHWEQSRQRRAQEAGLQQAARTAKAAYINAPDDGDALCAWRDANARLQEFHLRRSQQAALHAGVVWHHYGEQPTFYFHHLARQRQDDTTIRDLLVPAAGPQPLPLSSLLANAQAGQLLHDSFSGDSAQGFFRLRSTDAASQDRLLASLGVQLPPCSVSLAEGPRGDGSITEEELFEALRTLPRGKRAGSDGIPYEFYLRFWQELGTDFTAMVNEVFHAPSAPALTPTQLTGLIVLIFKGKGSRAEHGNYRPITLLNTDCKIIAKALALRFGAALSPVIDSTQTAFLPGRWIGDNILCHLEEIDYLQHTQQPGCIVFLDFQKAYDRLDRGWLLRCMEALGFGAGARRWASLMLAGTKASVLLNGFSTPRFNIYSGLPQGSPLSPILYVIAAQPLSSHLRLLHRNGRIRSIALPSGLPAPVCHQHADDTTIHVQSLQDASIALTDGVQVFCAASAARLNVGKSKGLLLGSAAGLVGPDPLTGITFASDDQPICHLGVQLGRDADSCRDRMYNPLLAAIRRRAAHWATHGLTFLGRVYVARQVFASAIYHFATFVSPSPRQLSQIHTLLCAFAARGDSAVEGGAPRLAPKRAVCCLPWASGGVRMADVPIMIQALQAKVIARLLSPERLPWKVFAAHWITTTDRMGVGLSSIFSGSGHHRLSIPARLRSYLTAFLRLQPHRLQPASALSYHQVMREPLFNNRQVLGEGGKPLTGTVWVAVAQAGLRSVQDLRDFGMGFRQHGFPGDLLRQLLSCLPASWQQHVQSPQVSGEWRVSLDGSTVCQILQGAVVQQYDVLPSACLQLCQQTCVDASGPGWRDCLTVCWSVARRQQSPAQPSGASQSGVGACRYLVGAWGDVHLDPTIWGFGKEGVLQYAVAAAADRLKAIRLLADSQVTFVPGHGLRPAIWQDDWGGAAEGLAAVEAGWAGAVEAREAARLFFFFFLRENHHCITCVTRIW
jgi:hypothetical protein